MPQLQRGATLAYLAGVLLLGGASAAGWGVNLLLQLGGALLLSLSLWDRSALHPPSAPLRLFGWSVAVLAAIQFLPLPPVIWTLLPGRGPVLEGFALLNIAPPWLTLSMAPWHSLLSLCWWIPAVALFAAMRHRHAPSFAAVTRVIAGIAVLSVVLGAVQRSTGQAYIYTITNYGTGPGFFANSNHQGSFLLTTLALFGGQAIGQFRRKGPTPKGTRNRLAARFVPVASAVVCAVLAAGIALSGSLACVCLLVPVALALAAMAWPGWRMRFAAVAAAGVSGVLLLAALLAFGPLTNDLTARGIVPGISRLDFLINGLQALRDVMPFGSGLGSFELLYRRYEDSRIIGTTFVNHAHDDLLELLIETGLFGAAALACFLRWLAPRCWHVWSGARDDVPRLAASAAIGVVLAHSLVDYPLRTAAMSAIVALACALLDGRRHGRPKADTPV